MAREIQTAVQIANMALRIMQAAPMESFDEDSLTAQSVKMYYDVTLRRCLSAFPWAFCTKEWELTKLPQSPLAEWQFSYKLPPDFVSLTWIKSGTYRSPFTRPPGRNLPSANELHHYEIVSGNILCCNDDAPIFARYAYEPPVELYPHYFIDLLVSALVEELSAVFGYNIAGQRTYHERVLGPYGKLGTAILQEMGQHPHCQRHRPSRVALERNW